MKRTGLVGGLGVLGQLLGARACDDEATFAFQVLGYGRRLESPAVTAVDDDDYAWANGLPDQAVQDLIGNRGRDEPVVSRVPGTEVEVVESIQQTVTAVIEEQHVLAPSGVEEVVGRLHDLGLGAVQKHVDVVLLEQADLRMRDGIFDSADVVLRPVQLWQIGGILRKRAVPDQQRFELHLSH